MAFRPWKRRIKRTPYRALVLEPGKAPVVMEHPWTAKLVPVYLRSRTRRVRCAKFMLDEGWLRIPDKGDRNVIAEQLLELDGGENAFGTCLILGWDPQLEQVISVSDGAVAEAMKVHHRLSGRA